MKSDESDEIKPVRKAGIEPMFPSVVKRKGTFHFAFYYVKF